MQALARLTSQALGRKAKSAKWLRSHRFRTENCALSQMKHRFCTESCALSQMKNVQISAQWFQNFQNDYISAKWFCSQLLHKKRCVPRLDHQL